MHFLFTNIIYTGGTSFFHAEDPRPMTEDIEVSELDGTLIKPTHIYPNISVCPIVRLPASAETKPDNHIKRPNLQFYEPGDKTVSKVFFSEARKASILSRTPHPNIAEFRGVIVEDDLIKAIVYKKYKWSLSERMRKTHASDPVDVEQVMRGLEAGVAHLRSEFLNHNDLHPGNVLLAEGSDEPVIIGLASASTGGTNLIKGGTPGWCDNHWKSRKPNDDFSLKVIREYLESGGKKIPWCQTEEARKKYG